MAIKDIKKKILSAAVKELIRFGYRGARMQAVADKAGINKALLHYHFSSKKKLYEQVVRENIGRMMHSILEQLQSEDEFDMWLRKLIRKYLRQIASRPQFLRFLIWELNENARHLTLMFSEALQKTGKTQGDIMDSIRNRLKSAGLEEYEPEQFILNLLSLCIYPSLAMPIFEQVIGIDYLKNKDFLVHREEEIYTLIKHGIIQRGGNGL